jgi:hypothetical protein
MPKPIPTLRLRCEAVADTPNGVVAAIVEGGAVAANRLSTFFVPAGQQWEVNQTAKASAVQL